MGSQQFWQTHFDVFHHICDDNTSDLYQKFWMLSPYNQSTLINVPKVYIYASLLSGKNHATYLCISYFIQKVADIPLDTVNNNPILADYLWLDNCLECFVTYDTKAYFEGNLALDGRHNLYTFDDYRTPNITPPKQAKNNDVLFMVQNTQDNLTGFYSRHIYLCHTHAKPNKINPCVILYHNKAPIFYAITHANPPDFHNKTHWQAITIT